MRIVKAQPGDIDAVCILYKQFYAYYATQQPDYYKEAEPDREYFAKILESDMDIIFIAFDGNDAPVGICHIAQKQTPPVDFYVPHKFAVLIDLFVTNKHRGGGIGTDLLNEAKNWTRARKLDYLELRVLQLNEFARRFYERENFDVTAHTMRCML
jgi:GNAT superfamily N-acetyltransferase